jgi:hypothetical protein
MLNSGDIVGIVEHWVETPINSYLGSGYGSELKAMLQKPFSSGMADAALKKLRDDVPLIGALPVSAVNMYAKQNGHERVDIAIDVAGSWVQAGTSQAGT